MQYGTLTAANGVVIRLSAPVSLRPPEQARYDEEFDDEPPRSRFSDDEAADGDDEDSSAPVALHSCYALHASASNCSTLPSSRHLSNVIEKMPSELC